MGFTVKFNWVLQTEPPEALQPACTYPFNKSGNRVFPVDTPIDLIDNKRNAIAKIKIKTFTNEKENTSGLFEVIKIYKDQEKITLSTYWVENE